jgi:hypothetical protein
MDMVRDTQGLTGERGNLWVFLGVDHGRWERDGEVVGLKSCGYRSMMKK